VNDFSQPAIRRVVDAAARKGVRLDITILDESAQSDEELAALIGADLGQIVKALVFVAPRAGGRLAPIVCLVSARDSADTGRLAASAGEAFIRRATAAETVGLTGFLAGSMPPFGHGHDVRVVMDQGVGRYPVVWASGGTPDSVFPVPPATLRALAGAFVAPVAETVWTSAPAVATEPRLRLETGSSAV
jgi:prolyl-tRNA editing enzyme YbaK/EbsC (Cys-tRNA(Pro) deacylase)